MRSKTPTSASLLLLMAWPAIGADGISHEKIPCVPAGGNARVIADLPAGDSASSVRTYFRARDSKDEAFIEMLRGERERYWGVLPVTSGKTGPVSYRIVAQTNSGRQLTTATFVAPVSEQCQVVLTAEEARFARNLVIGQTRPGAPDVPFGFECLGIGGRISSDGELRAISPCAQMAAAGRAGSPGPRQGATTTGGVTAAGQPCDGCTPADGALTLGGKGGVSVPGGVIPPPVSPARPKPE